MPRRKITAELWQQLLSAYQEWEPGTVGAPGIDDLIRPYGVSKQAFYSELNRRGVALKGRRQTRSQLDEPTRADEVDPTARFLLDELFNTRLRVLVLEKALRDAGLPIP